MCRPPLAHTSITGYWWIMTKWTTDDIADQSGRTVFITGANSGLGLHSAFILAAKGARVLLACRSKERGQIARAEVEQYAAVEPELVELDLADLSSVRAAATRVRDLTGDKLDVLMNNAGVMATPERRTADGFELQIGTNHLGHAALTWLLMPALRGASSARVVTLSSLAHRRAKIDTDDLNFQSRTYRPEAAYGQSKLANLLFMLELDRKVRAAGLNIISAAAHPGLTDTELMPNSMRMRVAAPVFSAAVTKVNRLITQSVPVGTLPQLYAACARNVSGGDYFGPSRLGEIRGHPSRALLSSTARDSELAAR